MLLSLAQGQFYKYQKGNSMKYEIEILRDRVKVLEEENTYLKKLLMEAGINYEKDDILDIHNISYEQARIFFSYFWGRTDVYAKRYYNQKTGASGYFPQCNNFWKYGVCPKADNKKIQCKDCKNKSWIKLGFKQIEGHIKGSSAYGTDVIGVYPLFENGNCRFIVFDFDNHMTKNDDIGFDMNDNTWREEVDSLRTICRELSIPFLVERSRSGNGAHLWIFFKKEIDASLARKFGFALLEKGAEFINLTSFRYYDRMLPAQDTLNNSGLGNLIALPLQGNAMKNGNSVFVDENWNPYDNQWKVLTNTLKLTEDRILELLKHWALDDKNEEKVADKPWKRDESFSTSDVNGEISIILSNVIYIDKSNLKPKIQNQIRRLAAVSNPLYFKNYAMGLSNLKNSRYIYMGYDDSQYICLPRGAKEILEKNCEKSGIRFKVNDQRNSGQKINVTFSGRLRDEQMRAVESVKNVDAGIISAATAFGKTVVCSNIIASKKVSTLILLESSALIEQWQKALESFLIIDEKLPEYITPTGRVKRRKSMIGLIHGSKDTSTGIIDIAMVRSLKKNGELHNRLKSYGMIIVDECHHSASDTMSEILMEVDAKYVYGITATPFRGDGLDKINNLLLGPIRFQYTAKEQAKNQGIEHYVIPRFTRVINPHGRSYMNINEAYKFLKDSKIRNIQICDDIKKCVEEGRTPVVLTKYKDHAQLIYKTVEKYADKVFLLTGDLSKKQQKEIREKMELVKDKESMILIGTGQLIGEGFDFPRLDTLIMAMPVSFKGIVEQYAGRLNRNYKGKENVVIYDYIDSYIKVFNDMYAKRLKAYKKIGYSLKMKEVLDMYQNNSIYDYDNYKKPYNIDLSSAQKSIFISSPQLKKRKVLEFIEKVKPMQEQGVKISILTMDPDAYKFDNASYVIEIIGMINNSGIEVILIDDSCLYFTVIDQNIVWYGNINFLGKESIEDNVMRVLDHNIANDLLELGLLKN